MPLPALFYLFSKFFLQDINNYISRKLVCNVKIVFGNLKSERAGERREGTESRDCRTAARRTNQWATPQINEFCRTLMSFAAPKWDTSHLSKLRRALMCYAHLYASLNISNLSI